VKKPEPIKVSYSPLWKLMRFSKPLSLEQIEKITDYLAGGRYMSRMPGKRTTPRLEPEYVKLIENLSVRRQAYESTQAWNVAGLSTEQRVTQDVAIEQLHQDYLNAQKAVDDYVPGLRKAKEVAHD
jgi:hypothetical protein